MCIFLFASSLKKMVGHRVSPFQIQNCCSLAYVRASEQVMTFSLAFISTKYDIAIETVLDWGREKEEKASIEKHQ
jgi:hypothetical protein